MFVAGAAARATSLGTTFAILSAAGLSATRLGVVLMSAAMLDDVVGLVMIQIISVLGGATTSLVGVQPWTVMRPIVASMGVVVVTSFAARYALPVSCASSESESPTLVYLAILSVWVVPSAYAGASVLLGAFSAGVAASYVDFAQEYATSPLFALQEYMFAPFFFASIGFAIPIPVMFSIPILPHGIMYAVLMTFGKLVVSIVILMNWKEKSWFSAMILGIGMVARGEIGLLIAGIGQAGGTLSDELFGILVWAIVLCTLVGPIGVGGLIKWANRKGDVAARLGKYK